MKYLSLLLSLLFFSLPAFATDVGNVPFTAPDEREDGSALPFDQICCYNAYVNDVLQSEQLPQSATSFTTPPLNGGLNVIELQTVDTDGRISQRYTVNIQVPFAPNPPSGDSTYTITFTP
jgi:hypothetical protein